MNQIHVLLQKTLFNRELYSWAWRFRINRVKNFRFTHQIYDHIVFFFKYYICEYFYGFILRFKGYLLVIESGVLVSVFSILYAILLQKRNRKFTLLNNVSNSNWFKRFKLLKFIWSSFFFFQISFIVSPFWSEAKLLRLRLKAFWKYVSISVQSLDERELL